MIHAKSHSAPVEPIGRTFGLLTIVRLTDERIRGVKVYECRCECGNVDKASIPLLMMGHKRSCGCQNRTGRAAKGASLARSTAPNLDRNSPNGRG